MIIHVEEVFDIVRRKIFLYLLFSFELFLLVYDRGNLLNVRRLRESGYLIGKPTASGLCNSRIGRKHACLGTESADRVLETTLAISVEVTDPRLCGSNADVWCRTVVELLRYFDLI